MHRLVSLFALLTLLFPTEESYADILFPMADSSGYQAVLVHFANGKLEVSLSKGGMTYAQTSQKIREYIEQVGTPVKTAEAQKVFGRLFASPIRFQTDFSKWGHSLFKGIDQVCLGGSEKEYVEALQSINALPLRPVFELSRGGYQSADFLMPGYADALAERHFERATSIYRESKNPEVGEVRSPDATEIRRKIADYRRLVGGKNYQETYAEIQNQLEDDLYQAWMWGRPPGKSATRWGHNISREQLNHLSLERARLASEINMATLEMEAAAKILDANYEKRLRLLKMSELVVLARFYGATYIRVQFAKTLFSALQSDKSYSDRDVLKQFHTAVTSRKLDLSYDKLPGKQLHEVISSVLNQKLETLLAYATFDALGFVNPK